MGKTKSIVDIQIPAPKTKYLVLQITGVTPYLSHKFSDTSKEAIKGNEGGKARCARGARNPKQEYEESLYRLPSGKYGIPSSAFKKAAVDACCMVDGIPKTLASKAFFVMEDLVEIKSKKGPTMREDIVFVGGFPRRSATLRYRGEFPDWKTEITVRYNESVITGEQIANLFQLAGLHIGVGDYRLESGKGTGRFGAFDIGTKG